MLTPQRKRQIENEAIRLRWDIWNERGKLWPGRHPHPLEVLNAQIAANILGYDLQYVPALSLPFSDTGGETAGVLDRPKKTILVAECYGREVRSFTSGHELGHVVLHDQRVMHRDLPIRGLEQESTDPVEREANYFAGCYLMPPDFLARVFKDMFGAAPFTFDYAAASFLRPQDSGSLLYAPHGSLTRYRALASARSYAVRAFGRSLAEMFQVSIATMAIRLRELDLVRHAVES
ncbi:MAG: ImmA/IrrE family metallo-endopeptidase [Burkholderiales bacterium]